MAKRVIVRIIYRDESWSLGIYPNIGSAFSVTRHVIENLVETNPDLICATFDIVETSEENGA